MAKKKKEVAEEALEKKLWKAADKLRKNMDAAEYKHVALGLIFLKYISDAFEELHGKLKEGKGEYQGADPEDKNEYVAEKVFYVPPSSRWSWLQGRAKLPTIGKDIDDAMDAIEKDNPSLRGVLPKVYAQEKLDKQSVGGLIDLISTAVLGTKEAQSKDVLGRVYEYFLGEFALAEGKKGGQFYTPASVVKLLVEMLEPYEGRVFDPCCGSGGMFVQSEKFIKSHQDHYKKNPANGGSKKLSLNPADHISIYGQESNQTTWRLAKMNLAIRGIDSSNVKWNNEGSFLNDAHKDLKADYIIANPPFNDTTDVAGTYTLAMVDTVGNLACADTSNPIYLEFVPCNTGCVTESDFPCITCFYDSLTSTRYMVISLRFYYNPATALPLSYTVISTTANVNGWYNSTLHGSPAQPLNDHLIHGWNELRVDIADSTPFSSSQTIVFVIDDCQFPVTFQTPESCAEGN